MMGFTKVQNWIFDKAMRELSPNAFKVVCVVIRKTSGFQKSADTISLSQFIEMTGIAGKSNLMRAIREAEGAGYIARIKNGNSYIYAVGNVGKSGTQVVTKRDSHETGQSRNGTENGHEIGLAGSHETGHTKENKKRKKKEETQQPDRVDVWCAFFSSLFGYPTPINDRYEYEDNWRQPIAAIMKHLGDDEQKVEECITDSYKLLRKKGYTIRSPKSILKTALNWQPVVQEKEPAIVTTDDGGFYV